jgi:membrane protease YdiL (CAAX protease family)
MLVSFRKATVIYLSGMLVCTLFNLAGHALDIRFDTHSLFAILFKLPAVGMIVGIMVGLRNAKIVCAGKFLTPHLLWLLLPFCFGTLVNLGHPTLSPTVDFILLTFTSMITTIVWEELFFHYVGQMLFERNDRYTLSALAVLVLGFGLSHLCYIMLDPSQIEHIVWQTILTSCFGFFSLTLYAKTQNIWITMLAHLAMNIPNTVSELYHETPFLADFSLILDSVYCICLVIGGTVLYHMNKERKHLAPLPHIHHVHHIYHQH